MKQIFFVYLLTFANGKVYVGMSKTDSRGRTDNRYRQHEWTAKSGKLSPIYNAWRKHGAPVQSITSTHPTREACALAEIDAIQAYDSMNPARGYNLQPGGQGLHAPAGSAVYELMRAKVWHNPERRRKASEALKGKLGHTVEVTGPVGQKESGATTNGLYNSGSTTGVGYDHNASLSRSGGMMLVNYPVCREPDLGPS